MKKTIIISAALALCASLNAQNVNQTVTVTNDYKSGIGDVEKKILDMNVPDTLLVFDYKFDYSVFESPYKGAYEFSPYSVKFTPTARHEYINRLYVKAGLGYSLHPELDADWEIRPADNVSLSVFARGNGYAGKYAKFVTSPVDFSETKNGHDFSDNIGVSGRVNFNTADLNFEAGHDGIYTLDEFPSVRSGYNSAYIGGRLSSNGERGSFFYYDFAAGYRFGNDDLETSSVAQQEHIFNLAGTFGPVLDTDYRFLVDVDMTGDWVNGWRNQNQMVCDLTPHVEFVLGPVQMSAGLVFGCIKGEQLPTIFPSVKASIGLFDDRMTAYAGFVGGDRPNTYYGLKTRNHFFTPAYLATDSLRVSKERFNLYAGVRSQYEKLQYDVNFGYSRMLDMPTECLLPQIYEVDSNLIFFEGIKWLDYNLFHADANLSWTSDRLYVAADAALRLTKYDQAAGLRAFALPVFSTGIAAEYNWSKRIYAGITLDAQTSMVELDAADAFSIPGWADLGINGRYVYSDTWSFWAKAGNILNQDVRRSLLHMPVGPYITLGAVLTL